PTYYYRIRQRPHPHQHPHSFPTRRSSDLRLQIVRLPNDHTHGTTLGKPTPTAYVADNDLAFGQIVEAVSHSKFWPQTAIFVVERSEEHTSELQSPDHLVCRLLLEKKK